MSFHSISARLAAFTVFAGLLLVTIAAVGLLGGKKAVDALNSVYEDRTVPLVSIFRIAELRAANEKEILLILQRDPRSPLSGAHGQPLSEHFANFERRSAEINALWNKYMATNLSEEEKRLATDFASKRSAWIERVRPLFERIKAEDYAPEVSRALLATTLDEGKAVRDALDVLAAYQANSAKVVFEEEQSAFRADLILLAIVGLGGLLGLGVYAWWLARTITHPINQAVSVAEAIANGELNRPVPTGGRDEAGRLLAAFAQMQDSLRTMVSASQRSADDLAGAAVEMSTAAQASAAATNAQSEAAAGMAAAVEEMSVSIDQVRDHAREARHVVGADGKLTHPAD